MVERYPALVDGAFVIIGWVGIKLLIEYLHGAGYIPFEIPKWLSLGLIVVIFVAAFIWAQREERRKPTTTEMDTRDLFDEDTEALESGGESRGISQPRSFNFRSARLSRLSGARGGAAAARYIRSRRRISISSGEGAGVRSS